MEYMKHAPKELKPEYIELMRDIWPETPDLERKDGVEKQYTHKSVVLIRECGRGKYTLVHKAICTSNIKIVAIKEIIGLQSEFRHLVENSLDELYSIIRKSSESLPECKDNTSLSTDVHPIFNLYDTYSFWLLPSEYIINFYDAYINPLTGSVCLVFEYFNNGTLEDEIALGVKPEENDIGTVAYVILQALVEYHNQNCTHRDIKPSNILIGENGKIKVSDSFNIATFDNIGSHRTFTGTLLYMSPERIRDESYSTSSDIWSLGILLLRFATNNYPFPTTSAWTLAEQILKGPSMEGLERFSSELRDFIAKSVQLQPDLRPSAQELLQHPFIQIYVSNQIKTFTDPTCLSSYEVIENVFNLSNDFEKCVDAIIEDQLEEQLSHLWIDPNYNHCLKIETLSIDKLQYLSKQLQSDPELLINNYHQKVTSMDILLHQTLFSLKQEPRAFSPRLVKLIANHILKEQSEKFAVKGIPNTDDFYLYEDSHATSNDADLLEILKDCRIPLADAKKYVDSCTALGYEDWQSIQEDMPLSTLESELKPGHYKRVLKKIEFSKDSKLGSETNKDFDVIKDSKESFVEAFKKDSEASKDSEESFIGPLDYSLKHSMECEETAEYSTKTVYFIREIGRGTSGIVYKSFVRPSLNTCAVKHAKISTSKKKKEIFNELNILWKLKESTTPWESQKFGDLWNVQSPYFVSFHNAYIDTLNSGVCMVFDHMAGGSLQAQIDDKKIIKQIDDVAVVAYSMLNALNEMHKRNIVHRDIKPGNILINYHGMVKCADFGIVTELEDSSTAKTFTGTLLYMSPERILGKPYTKAADVWSLGISLMVYATNVCPYPINGYWILSEAIQHGPSMAALITLPDDFKDFIWKCVALEEADRETAETLLSHQFINNFLSRSTSSDKDPLKLRNYKLIESTVDRQGDLDFILDTVIKLGVEKHIETLRAAKEGDAVEPLKVLQKIQLSWLSSQLFLDFDYVQDAYSQKSKGVSAFLSSALVQQFITLKRTIEIES